MPKQLTTSARLWLLTWCVVLGMAVLGGAGMMRLASMGQLLQQDLEEARAESHSLVAVKNAQTSFLLQIKAFKDVLIRGNAPDNFQKYSQEYTTHAAEVKYLLEQAMGGMKARHIPLETAEALLAAHTTLTAQYLQALKVFDQHNPESGKEIDKQVKGLDRPTNEAMNKLVADIERHFASQLAQQQQEANQERIKAIRFTSGVVFIIIMVTLGLAIMINREILRQLGGDPAYAATIVKAIANGDLTTVIRLKPGDKGSLLAQMHAMQCYLGGMISKIRLAGEQLAGSSQQLSSAAQQVAASADQQSQSSSSMAALIEELTVSIGQVSGNATLANSMAGQSRLLSREGHQQAQNTVGGIQVLQGSVTVVSQAVASLGAQSEKITGIVNVIKDIADQTNLLALNAAIEAARAGESGRGFAVVADEVRKLAERTSLSTREIATVIDQINHETSMAVSTMEAGSGQVQHSVDSVKATGQVMQQIEAGTNDVMSAIQQISSALHEQTAASQGIAKSVEQTVQLIEENTTAVQQVSQSAHYLAELAGELRDEVQHFRL